MKFANVLSPLALVAALTVPQATDAQVIHVDSQAQGANDGSSWTDAYVELWDALQAASGAGPIWVAAGIYKPPGADETFEISGDLEVYGGFSGTETSFEERAGLFEQTLLSADINGDDAPGFKNIADNALHVVRITGSPVLDGFTLQGGAALSVGEDGGGIMISSGAFPIIRHCRLRLDRASRGGGIFVSTGNAMISDCEFEGNEAASGGGVYNLRGSSTYERCMFLGNSARFGGGMYNANTSPRVDRCVFAENVASGTWPVGGFGGGMLNSNSHPDVTNALFVGNLAMLENGDPGGGALRNIGSHPTFTNCTFADGNLPGAVSSDPMGFPWLTNCIVWGNGEPQIEGTSVVTFSTVEGGLIGMGNIDADPRFVDPSALDYRLTPQSPCLDAGKNSAVPKDTTTDLAGAPRFVDVPCVEDTGDGLVPLVDMGAFELQVPEEDCNNNGVVDLCDIAEGESRDDNDNGIPDECEIPLIASSNPPNGAIDARQPHPLESTVPLLGWQIITLTFSAAPEAVSIEDFDIVATSGATPEIIKLAVDDTGKVVTLALAPPIPPGAWTDIAYTPTAGLVRLGFLPADVNGDGVSSPVDILDLVDTLNEVEPRPEWSTDANRSGQTEAGDILRVIDLLNGAAAYEPWNGRTLP